MKKVNIYFGEDEYATWYMANCGSCSARKNCYSRIKVDELLVVGYVPEIVCEEIGCNNDGLHISFVSVCKIKNKGDYKN